EDDLRKRQERALAVLGVPSPEHAEARWLDLESTRHESDVLRRELAIHAPDGLQAITRMIEDGRRLMQRLDARLKELPGQDEGDGRGQAALQAELGAAETRAGEADAHVSASRERLHTATSRSQELASRAAVLAARLGDATALASRQALDRRLVETRSQRDDLGRRVAAIEARIAGHRP